MVAILEAYNFVLVSYKRVGERIVLRGPLNPGAGARSRRRPFL